MLIRIIDLPAYGNSEDDAVRIEFQGEQWGKTYQTDLYDSPFSANFRKTLAWYFNQYPLQIDASEDKAADGEKPDDKGVVQKVIRAGQGIGDELMGDDYELVSISEHIGEQGYHKLDVELVSERIEFFTELWETLILPESKYMLSTVAKSFVRKIGSGDVTLAKLQYELKATAPTSDHVAQLLQGSIDQPSQNNQADDKPLNVLYWQSRPASVDMPFNNSNALNLAVEAKRAGGAVNYNVQVANGLAHLKSLLSDKANPVHVLHYDGPVFVEGDNVAFAMDEQGQELLRAGPLAQLLVDNNVALLTVDARRYQRETPKKVLAMIAKAGVEQGLGNVLGLSQITNPWTAGQCFFEVYRQIASGLALSQAVVEARKARQKVTTTELMTVEPLNFHDWSLLVHYSQQQVQFFSEGIAVAQQDDPNFLTQVNQKLFGYHAQLLPPLLFQAGDGQALQVLKQLEHNGGCCVNGDVGMGKSWLAHTVSVYLAVNKNLDYGFYFDFAQQSYSAEDMLEMIGRLLQMPLDDLSQVYSRLKDSNCLFVFENLHGVDESHFALLSDMFGTLRTEQHKVIATGLAGQWATFLDYPQVTIQPMDIMEQKVLAAHMARELKLTDVEFYPLLRQLNGHPWLTGKAIGLLGTTSASELSESLQNHINSQHDSSIVEQYYQWQWSLLSPASQTLLLLCSQTPGLLVEMVTTAAEKKEPSEAAGILFDNLGVKGTSFNTLLEQWFSAGFLYRYPHGRMVDSRCQGFLTQQFEREGIDDNSQLLFSQLLCEGIALLCNSVLRQPNQNITNNLLFNRRSWVAHFERLWFADDFKGFFTVKNTFDQLLMQAQLLPDSEAWTLDLLSRSPLPEDADVNRKVAWLSLAATVSAVTGASEYEFIDQAQAQWRQWYDSLDEDMGDEDRPLFQQSLSFLQGCYQRQQLWQDAILVTEKAVEIYQHSQAWQRMIHGFKALADYHSKMGEEDKALAYELKILDDIPYDSAPPSFKTQQLVEVMLARLTRGNTIECQKMLDQIRNTTSEGQNLGSMLDNVQCEIDLLECNYERALKHLAAQWAMASQESQGQPLEGLRMKLSQVAEKATPQLFDEIFVKNLPQGVEKPF